MIGFFFMDTNSSSMKLLDWSVITAEIIDLQKIKIRHNSGSEAYAPLDVFKPMLLSQWHSLLDAQMEPALRMRLAFIVFVNFEAVTGELFDTGIICRFRNKMMIAGLDHKLLYFINHQLLDLDLKIQDVCRAALNMLCRLIVLAMSQQSRRWWSSSVCERL